MTSHIDAPEADFVLGWDKLAEEIGIPVGTLKEIHDRIDLMPLPFYHKPSWPRAHVPMLIERIYLADNVRRSTLISMFNKTGCRSFQEKDFVKVQGRWVIK